jgi:surface antigen
LNNFEQLFRFSLFVWVAGLLCSGFTFASAADDYPFPTSKINEASNPYDPASIDPWKFFNRECTSFVAWRINRDAGTVRSPYFFQNHMFGGHWGNAAHWTENARRLGYTVDNVPEVGAIVHFGSFEAGAKRSGHVSYVEQVNPDRTVNLSEYCWTTRCGYGMRYNVRAPRFIHLNKFRPGEMVQAAATVNVRSFPGSVASAVPARRRGETGRVIEGPAVAAFPTTGVIYRWYKVRWENNESGWSVELPLQKAPAGAP